MHKIKCPVLILYGGSNEFNELENSLEIY